MHPNLPQYFCRIFGQKTLGPIGFKNNWKRHKWKIEWEIWAHFIFSAHLKETTFLQAFRILTKIVTCSLWSSCPCFPRQVSEQPGRSQWFSQYPLRGLKMGSCDTQLRTKMFIHYAISKVQNDAPAKSQYTIPKHPSLGTSVYRLLKPLILCDDVMSYFNATVVLWTFPI